MTAGSFSGGKRLANGMSPEDGDNRTRNAKAQRRHREKRKQHLKTLEDSVAALTAQLDDALRQLGQPNYAASSSSRPTQPFSPQSKDFSQLQAENAYLRDENADLRRQVYSYRVNYGHLPPVPPGAEQGKEGAGGSGWNEVKQEGAFGVAYGQNSMTSPQRGESGHGRGVRQSVDFVGDVSASNAGSSSAPSSTSSYPPQLDHFTPINSRSRTRVASSSSAPHASPYAPSNNYPDQRYASTSNHTSGPGPSPGSSGPHPNSVRYDSMYPAPPPHSLPRPSPGTYDMQGHGHPYAPRSESEGMAWNPESGPPPFPSSVSYPMGFGHDNHQGGEDWRQDH